jgi:deoxyribose-phosphate aldolase
MLSFEPNALLERPLADLLRVLENKAITGGCPLCEQCNAKCEQRVRELLTPRAEAWSARFRTEDPAILLAGVIDHTLLKPAATPAQVEALCAEARAHRFCSVCVNPRFVPLCMRLLQGSGVLTCTVVGFPLGATSTYAKVEETRQAVRDGAREVDMVLAIGELKAGNDRVVQEEIARIAEVCHAGGAILKVIIETALLNDAEKVRACQASVEARADFVKTSTGFAQAGANPYDVLLMRYTVGKDIGVKAAGGIRTLADTLEMLVAGASRIGASAGVAILTEVNDV